MERLKRYGKVALAIGMLALVVFVPLTSCVAEFTAPAVCDAFHVDQHVVVRGWGDGVPRRVTEPYVTCSHYHTVRLGSANSGGER